MNAGPTSVFWTQVFGSLALETTIIFLLALLIQRCGPSAVWRRLIWQAALVAFALILVLELSGLSRASSCWATARIKATKRMPAAVSTPPNPRLVSESAVIEPATILAPPVSVPVSNRDQESRVPWWPGIIWLAGFGFVA